MNRCHFVKVHLLIGDQLYSEKLIRDIAVLALDHPYYPVTIEWGESL